MSFRIVETHTQKVICDGLASYTEAWGTLEQLPKEEAESLKAALEAVGAEVELK